MKLIKYIQCTVIVFSLIFLSFGFNEGDGLTSQTAFQISTCDQLQNISNNLNSYFEIVQNIDCSDTVDWNNGEGFHPINNFNGYLEGNKRAIRDLYINRSNSNGVGLFGTTTSSSNGVIANLRLENVIIIGNRGVGGIGGENFYVDIYNSSVSGYIEGSNNRVGGLVGQSFSSEIDQVVFVGEIVSTGTSSNQEVGGIVGRTSGSANVGTAFTRAIITANNGCVGGIIGDSSTGTSHFNEVYSVTQILGSPDSEGTIVGCIRNTLDSFTNVYWDIDVGGLDWRGSVESGSTGNPINVTGFNTSQMQGSLAQINFAGFDFENTWRTITLPEDNYPVFFWQAGNLVSVTGQLINSLTGEPVSNAFIIANPDDSNFGKINTTTNSTGHYNITLQSVPEYEVIIRENITDPNFNNFTFLGGVRQTINPNDGTINFELGPYWEGSGEGENPFLITNVEELQTMRYNLLGNYQLANDIDATQTRNWFGGEGFEPIGDEENPFQGSLNGNSSMITSLFINRTLNNQTALFSFTQNASIIDMALEDLYVAGDFRVGGLIGRDVGSNTTIQRVLVSGIVEGNNDVGGIVASVLNRLILNQTFANVTVAGLDGSIGGLVGWSSNSTIVDSYAIGNVTGAVDVKRIGGLVGDHNGVLNRTYATGYVSTSSFPDQIGGLVGRNTGLVYNSFWDNEASGQNESAGGMGFPTANMTSLRTFLDAGWDLLNVWGINTEENGGYPFLLWQDFESSYPFQEGLGTNDSPYLIFTCEELQLMNTNLRAYYELANNIDCSDTINWNEGDGFEPVGTLPVPFEGSLQGNSFIINDLFINRTATNQVGLFGTTCDVKLTNIVLEDVFILGDFRVGGLVGRDVGDFSILENISVSGNVKGITDVGGVLASVLNKTFVSQIFSNVNVYGSDGSIGGLIGWSAYSEVLDSYSIGDVIGNDTVERIGGLVGDNYGFINRSYSTSFVSLEPESDFEGGLVGRNRALVQNSYWDTQTSGQNESAGGEGKTTSEMRLVFTFENWDFNNTWSATCDGWHYPVLQWQNLYLSETQCPNYVASSSRGGSSSSRTEIITQSQVSVGSQTQLREGRDVQFESLHTSVTPDLNPQSPQAREFRHTVRLNRIQTNFVDITIHSDPINVRLPLGEDVRVDLDRDGIDDVLLRFEGIYFAEARIHIEQLQILQEEEVEAEAEIIENQQEETIEQIPSQDETSSTQSSTQTQESVVEETSTQSLQEEEVEAHLIQQKRDSSNTTTQFILLLIGFLIILASFMWFLIIEKRENNK
ncbi:MAG: carboxypeptidase-like regulatory domain-containing protein [Nanoarchaeota archaeon]|nr:carboxypeptidase-like regulatory domain-containing protein [Nanoarchaeota archaeon]